MYENRTEYYQLSGESYDAWIRRKRKIDEGKSSYDPFSTLSAFTASQSISSSSDYSYSSDSIQSSSSDSFSGGGGDFGGGGSNSSW